MIRRSIVMAALIVGAVLIVAPGAFSADRAEALFQDGVRAYEAGNYTGAGELFEEAAASGVVNGKLYYNAGNAWFKAGELGRAVLWYKRAERLMPADPDLAYNLGRAEAQVRDSRDAPGYAKMALGRWMGFWPPGLAAWLAVGFNLLFWGLLAARRTGAPAFLGREAGAWVRGVRSAALACAVVFTPHGRMVALSGPLFHPGRGARRDGHRQVRAGRTGHQAVYPPWRDRGGH